jgi:eukaryotic-like serine/threonine-protein kinase
MDLMPGAVIAGRYRVQHKVGVGGMGEVWAAEHVAIGVKVALKKLLPAAAVDHQIVARFKREAYLLGRIRSEHVARVVDFIADTSFGLVLVMDFVEGEPLMSALLARQLGIEETIDLGVDIAEALCDLHRAQIVHRDLKPDNIIMEPLSSGRRRAVLVDFGVSRLVTGNVNHDEDITGITHADMAVGTIAYMAPEQLLSSRDVTGASDVYALGAILYRAVAGRHAFGDFDDADYAKRKLSLEPELLQLNRNDRVAQGFQTLVARSLRRLPAARFQSAAAMLIELAALRDIARAMSLDLDASTDEGPRSTDILKRSAELVPNSQRVFKVAGAPVDPTSLTLPSIDSGAMLRDDVSTMDPTQKYRLAKAPPLDPSRTRPMPIGQGERRDATAVSPRALLANSNHGPGGWRGDDAIQISRQVAAVALVVTLLGGMLLGILIHWSVSDEPAATPPSPPSASGTAAPP